MMPEKDKSLYSKLTKLAAKLNAMSPETASKLFGDDADIDVAEQKNLYVQSVAQAAKFIQIRRRLEIVLTAMNAVAAGCGHRINAIENVGLSKFISEPDNPLRLENCDLEYLDRMGIYTVGDLIQIAFYALQIDNRISDLKIDKIRNFLKENARPMFLDEENKELLAAPVSELHLSVRARKAMKKMRIETVGQLTWTTAATLLECENFGVTTLNEVREKIEERGLRLRDD